MKQIDENKLNQLLEFVKNFQIKEGRSPSIRQVANALNITSTATAQKYVKKLHERNLIERDSFGKVITPVNLQASSFPSSGWRSIPPRAFPCSALISGFTVSSLP